MNFFSDDELRARQDALNSQWNGLWGTYNATCSNGLGNAFPEFATDYNAWKDFYDSGSDWTSGSKHITDQHQVKMQEWTKRLRDYGCGDRSKSDLGIPGVKDPPPDSEGLLDKLGNLAGAPFKFLNTLAWGAVIVSVLIIVGILWLIFRKDIKAGAGGVSISS